MIDYYIANIGFWAHQRNLIKGSTPVVQYAKLVEEVGELSKALTRQGIEEQKKEVGDCIVVLSIMCEQLGIELEDCVEAAYNSIKDRKGKMVDGVFIKEEDL